MMVERVKRGVAPVASSLLLPLLLRFLAVAGERSMHLPGRQWEQLRPEQDGLGSEKLAAATGWLERHAGRDRLKELVVVGNGRLVWHGPKADLAATTWSMGKVLTSTALGLLVHEGKCRPDTRAAETVPALAGHYAGVAL